MSDVTAGQRIPPQSIEAEQAVLGALMMSHEAVSLAIEMLKSEKVFYRGSHRDIYLAILSLYEKNEPVDLLTLSEELMRMGSFEKIGGQAYLSELLSSVTTAANVEFHLKIVLEKYLYRQLINECTQIINESFQEKGPIEDLMDSAEHRLYKLSERGRASSFQSLKELLSSTITQLEQIHQNESDITGISSGFADMDRLTAGFQRGDLIILAGRPSMGKTAFGLNLARNAAVKYRHAVAFFSLEMSGVALSQRLLAIESLVDSQKLRTGRLNESDWGKLSEAFGALGNTPIYIDDTPNLNIMEMRSKARRLKADKNIEMILVDYLQMMESGVTGRSSENRQQEISQISRALKGLAKELDVPVIALSQLSREVEKRPDKRPMLSDLRESGAIEQDADVVIFVYRPEYYKIMKFPGDEAPTEGMAELIIGKQRNGPTGSVRLAFDRRYGKFQDLETHMDDSMYMPPPEFEEDGDFTATDITE